jgi:hypothetical protein
MKQLTLRLTDDEHAALVAWAQAENRSLHGLIIHLLRVALGQR